MMRLCHTFLLISLLSGSQSCAGGKSPLHRPVKDVVTDLAEGRITQGTDYFPALPKPYSESYRTDTNGAIYGLSVYRGKHRETLLVYWSTEKDQDRTPIYAACLASGSGGPQWGERWFFCDMSKLRHHIELALKEEAANRAAGG